MGLHSSPYVLQQFATLNLYLMKIKEQTRKLAAGCSKHCFEVVDRTDEVSSKHGFEVVDETDEVSNIPTVRRRWRGLNFIFEKYKNSSLQLQTTEN